MNVNQKAELEFYRRAKSDHQALEEERHQSAKLCDEVGRLREDIRQLRTECDQLKAQLEAAEQHVKILRGQLDQFHAAMDKEKSGKWREELLELSNRLDKYAHGDCSFGLTYNEIERAARELRATADCFTHKANFVPMELEIKELKAKLEKMGNENNNAVAQ